jgi:spore coat protein A
VKKPLKIMGLAMLTTLVLAGFQPLVAELLPEPQSQVLMPGATIPKFVDPLPVPGDITVIDAAANPNYNLFMMEFSAQILPSFGYPKSKVWGYRTPSDIFDFNRKTYIGPLVVAQRGKTVKATYRNDLFYPLSFVQPLLPVDLTTQWANPLGLVCSTDDNGTVTDPACMQLPSYIGPWPTAAHLHGGEVHPSADGGPDAWFTFDGRKGPGAKYSPLKGTTLTYPNTQEATTLWFHDHSLGTTRFGVFAGMAGMYILKDPAKEPAGLPAGKYDIPLIIQDKSFDTDGQIFYNLDSNAQPNPTIHPFWIPEFLGDAIVVNGKTWPYLNVEPRKYRFRVLNASQARFYNLYFEGNRSFKVIATDGGYLTSPKTVTQLLVGPAERYEIVVDFKGTPVGSKIKLLNDANTPFPDGGEVDPETTAQIMRFKVVSGSRDTSVVPNTLRSSFVDLTKPGAVPADAIKRQLTLNEIASDDGPLRLVLNNTEYNKVIAGFDGRDSEMPAVGDTEIWEIINISADAHPIHIHLIQFQVLNRQAISDSYALNYDAILDKPGPGEGPPFAYLVPNGDGAIGGNPAVGDFLSGNPVFPAAYEKGWKDTAIMMPGQVTRIAVRWAPTDAPTKGRPTCPTGSVPAAVKPCVPQVGSNLFVFNPTELVNGKVGYVWHCHILEHEDNEMMRPYIVGPVRQVP